MKIFSHDMFQYAGIVPIDPDDFIHREKFSEGPFMAFKEGRLSGLYQRDPRQETIIIILQVQYIFITSSHPMRVFDQVC